MSYVQSGMREEREEGEEYGSSSCSETWFLESGTFGFWDSSPDQTQSKPKAGSVGNPDWGRLKVLQRWRQVLVEINNFVSPLRYSCWVLVRHPNLGSLPSRSLLSASHQFSQRVFYSLRGLMLWEEGPTLLLSFIQLIIYHSHRSRSSTFT
jgi:hypothetical protein